MPIVIANRQDGRKVYKCITQRVRMLLDVKTMRMVKSHSLWMQISTGTLNIKCRLKSKQPWVVDLIRISVTLCLSPSELFGFQLGSTLYWLHLEQLPPRLDARIHMNTHQIEPTLGQLSREGRGASQIHAATLYAFKPSGSWYVFRACRNLRSSSVGFQTKCVNVV